MPPEAQPETAAEQESHAASWFDRMLDIIAPSDRRTMFVMATTIAVVGILFAFYAGLQSKAEAAIDARIEAKTGERLQNHETRLTAVEAAQKTTSDNIAKMQGDVRVIRTLIEKHYIGDDAPVTP